MSSDFEVQHPRGAVGRFAEKRNDAPQGSLDVPPAPRPRKPARTADPEWPGHFTRVDPDRKGALRRISREEFEARASRKLAAEITTDDTLLWREMTDAGERFWEEPITHVDQGIDLQYRRVTFVETARHTSQPVQFKGLGTVIVSTSV